jgi:predicted nucleotidyltransferase
MSSSGEFDPDSAAFYRRVLMSLTEARVPFLVGGALACTQYTGIERSTKDVDLFIRSDDLARAREALLKAGHDTELTYPHWLAKVHAGDHCLDLIFSSGNGVSAVDDAWFEHAADAELLGVAVKLAPVEETIWSKAFVMERERYDGADVAHLLHARARQIDWRRLLERFGPHWRVLLSHLVLFGFSYPDRRAAVPAWVMHGLLDRLRDEQEAAPPPERVCQGTLLSREQYLDDIDQRGYQDARLEPIGQMAADEVAVWTQAIPERPSGE